jgi:hypothetical protein
LPESKAGVIRGEQRGLAGVVLMEKASLTLTLSQRERELMD